jgi:formyl-CoA transferase
MYLTGQPDSPPTRVGSSIGDTVGGMNAVIAVLAALYDRQQTGMGQMVETSLVDGLISLSTQDYIRYFHAGEVPCRMGNIYKSWTPYGTYKAADGYYNLGVGTDAHFCCFAEAIGHPELPEDPRFTSHAVRVEHREELDSIINQWAADKTVAQICDIMVNNGVPVAPVNSIVEVSKDPHIAGAREMFPTLQQEGLGAVQVTNIPVRFARSGLVPPKSVALPGGDNEEVLTALGKTPEQIKALRQQGVI